MKYVQDEALSGQVREVSGMPSRAGQGSGLFEGQKTPGQRLKAQLHAIGHFSAIRKPITALICCRAGPTTAACTT